MSHHRPRHLLVTITAIAGAGILAAGCSAASLSAASSFADTHRHVVAGRAKLDEATDSATLPLDRYRGPSDGVVNYAQDLVIQKCLAAQGFNYRVVKSTGADPSAQWRSFGLWDPIEARTYGYALAPDPAFKADQALNQNMSAAETAAIGPCIHESNVMFSGPDQMARFSATNLGNEALAETLSDPKGKALVSTWQACMTSQGIAVGGKADGPLGADVDLDTMSSTQQIAIAVKDVACKTKDNIVQQLADLEAGYEETLIAQHRSDLSRQLDQADTVHKAAVDYIADHA